MQMHQIEFSSVLQYLQRPHQIYLVLVHSCINEKIPKGFDVSAMPLLTLTHYFHLISGSGWYFAVAWKICEKEYLEAKKQE